jgi:hypothetical protein
MFFLALFGIHKVLSDIIPFMSKQHFGYFDALALTAIFFVFEYLDVRRKAAAARRAGQ